jgi:uncharacterized lipoprotein YddW (UPF0748 family)
MNKREFLKGLGACGLVWSVRNTLEPISLLGNDTERKRKNWTWITTDLKTPADERKRQFARMREAGIEAVLPEIYDSRFAYYASSHLPVKMEWLEQLIPLAKAEGLEIHAWMWSMPCNIEDIRRKHHDWFCVNSKGESAADKPAYVDYYKFLCPSRPEVQQFLQTTVAELVKYQGLDGIHLDYIRFPDVILAEALQPKYGIVQDREYPQYDYCYCEVCRREFKSKTGLDPLQLKDPSTNQEWRQFRYDRITELVNNKLVPIAYNNKKMITAAVFPNWENVRQQWPVWQVDAVLPMLYHSFYGKDIGWIREQTQKGVKSLSLRIPLYSGLFVPELSPEALSRAIDASLEGGASGVSLFAAGAMTDAQWERFREKARR